MLNRRSGFTYAQEQFELEFKKVQADERKIAKETLGRRIVAYGFKLLAAVGGIVVAAGVDKRTAQFVGIAIAVAVTLDRVFSNHERLLVVLNARNAYRRLLNKVRREHQQKLTPILQLRDAEREPEAVEQGTALCKELLAKLHSVCETIEDAIADADLKALRSIALERPDERVRES